MNTKQRSKAHEVIALLRKVRAVEGEMTLKRLQTFLEVAVRDQMDLSTLIDVTDSTPSGATKTIASWCKHTAYKTPGPGYLESVIPFENQRTREIHLTPKGRAFAEMILS